LSGTGDADTPNRPRLTVPGCPRAHPARGIVNALHGGSNMNQAQFAQLLAQSLEHEIGGVQVYEAALECVINDELREEWQKYLGETRTHVETLAAVCEELGVDTDEDTPGRQIVRHMATALVDAMKLARKSGSEEAAELVACECVVIAETKDHLDWELIGKCVPKLTGDAKKTVKQAVDEIEEQEDEHLYHSQGWCRELWLQSLGMKAVLPPPEERKDVKTAIGAARAAQASARNR
jgi:rubrerythrin